MPDPTEAAARLVQDRIATLFERDGPAIDESATLEQLGLDSLDRAELALALEEAVGARYTDHDFVTVHTVVDLIALTRRKLAVAGARAEV